MNFIARTILVRQHSLSVIFSNDEDKARSRNISAKRMEELSWRSIWEKKNIIFSVSRHFLRPREISYRPSLCVLPWPPAVKVSRAIKAFKGSSRTSSSSDQRCRETTRTGSLAIRWHIPACTSETNTYWPFRGHDKRIATLSQYCPSIIIVVQQINVHTSTLQFKEHNSLFFFLFFCQEI